MEQAVFRCLDGSLLKDDRGVYEDTVPGDTPQVRIPLLRAFDVRYYPQRAPMGEIRVFWRTEEKWEGRRVFEETGDLPPRVF